MSPTIWRVIAPSAHPAMVFRWPVVIHYNNHGFLDCAVKKNREESIVTYPLSILCLAHLFLPLKYTGEWKRTFISMLALSTSLIEITSTWYNLTGYLSFNYTIRRASFRLSKIEYGYQRALPLDLTVHLVENVFWALAWSLRMHCAYDDIQERLYACMLTFPGDDMPLATTLSRCLIWRGCLEGNPPRVKEWMLIVNWWRQAWNWNWHESDWFGGELSEAILFDRERAQFSFFYEYEKWYSPRILFCMYVHREMILVDLYSISSCGPSLLCETKMWINRRIIRYVLALRRKIHKEKKCRQKNVNNIIKRSRKWLSLSFWFKSVDYERL